jgi:hypothetical protein
MSDNKVFTAEDGVKWSSSRDSIPGMEVAPASSI